jgi:dolichol-phosphate hexosyltransferase
VEQAEGGVLTRRQPVGHKAVTLAANVLYNARLSDLVTWQKVLKTLLVRSLRENRFAIEAEITAPMLRAWARIYEVPMRPTLAVEQEVL